ncbi:MAG: hypothetical protein ACR2QE_09365 [Acidimicrobiales bacterium]
MMRSNHLVVIALAAVIALMATACSVAESLPLPACSGGSSILIVAQSVPTAELLPCLGASDPTLPQLAEPGPTLPSGWESAGVTIDDNGMVVRLDSDRAGSDAAVLHFAETCEIGTSVSVPSDQEGADVLESIEEIEPGLRANRYYVFPGGCVWWEFDFADNTPAALAIELQSRLFLAPRQFVSDAVSQDFMEVDL